MAQVMPQPALAAHQFAHIRDVAALLAVVEELDDLLAEQDVGAAAGVDLIESVAACISLMNP